MASDDTHAYIPCTIQTCSISQAPIPYQPNLGAKVFFLTIFATELVLQLALSSFYRTWSYLLGMGGGRVLDSRLCGPNSATRQSLRVQLFVQSNSFIDHFAQYLGRTWICTDSMNRYLVCPTIAPAFISAVIYLCFYRIAIIYDHSLLRIKGLGI